MATYFAERALELLRVGSGLPDANFREGQEEAIRHIVEGRGKLLVVRKTGWGKSFVYFVATKMLREAGLGPALLISPLLALMRNQIAAAERMGLRAATINSENTTDWPDIEAAVRNDEVDILLISPERLANERFQADTLAPIAGRIALLVVDEAHCISDWGHDFRPHYRLIARIIASLPRNVRLLATTATANKRVVRDLRDILGQNVAISRGDLNRPSLTLQTIRMADPADRMAWLAQVLPSLPGSGIIYTLTVKDAVRLAGWLRSRGLDVEAYTGETGNQREALEQALINNERKALVATVALGMGFDKPDLGFVIHYQAPGSVIAYYQQVGRAGRALDDAYGALLSGDDDIEIQDYFIESAFPTRAEVAAVLDALDDAPEGLTMADLMRRVNVSNSRIDKTILLLSLESPAPIAKLGWKWQLTPSRLSDEFWERVERLTALRREEQTQMQEYAALTSGHMEYLIAALDGDPRRVGPPRLKPLPAETDSTLVQTARRFLRESYLAIEPRSSWTRAGLPTYDVKGTIPAEHRSQPGRALCAWGDGGWGRLVRQGKYEDARFSNELVDACAALARKWNPLPSPEWVTCVPSLRHPDLVSDFARRLAKRIGLPFVEALVQTTERPEQKAMRNSVQQALNLDGTLETTQNVPKGPVLLVDDMVDSRWTFTICAWLLRTHGSGEVFPLALAKTGFGQ